MSGAGESAVPVRTGRGAPFRPEVRDGQNGRDGAGVGAADGHDARLALWTAALAARLGPVCRHWDPAEFRAFVERLARRELRWADQDGHA